MGIAEAALALAVVGTAYSIDQQEAARRDRNRSRKEQAAANAERAAVERRQQIREERIRRAQLLQSATNTGVASSSGEFGTAGNLSTQLSTNLGLNASRLKSAARIGALEQSAANSLGNANNAMAGIGLVTSIFNTFGNQPPTVDPSQVQKKVNPNQTLPVGTPRVL